MMNDENDLPVILDLLRGSNGPSLIFRLRERAEIRSQIFGRFGEEGKPDKIAALLEEAADEIEKLMKTPDSMQCVVCDRSLDMIGKNQPSGGLGVSTTGHYGSTVFDPMDESTLTFVICDECITKKVLK